MRKVEGGCIEGMNAGLSEDALFHQHLGYDEPLVTLQKVPKGPSLLKAALQIESSSETREDILFHQDSGMEVESDREDVESELSFHEAFQDVESEEDDFVADTSKAAPTTSATTPSQILFSPTSKGSLSTADMGSFNADVSKWNVAQGTNSFGF